MHHGGPCEPGLMLVDVKSLEANWLYCGKIHHDPHLVNLPHTSETTPTWSLWKHLALLWDLIKRAPHACLFHWGWMDWVELRRG